MKKRLFAFAIFLIFAAYNLSFAQLTAPNNSFTNSPKINYYKALQASALQKVANPIYVKRFLANINNNFSYLQVTKTANFLINNATYGLSLPINAMNLYGSPANILNKNPDIYNNLMQLYSKLPTGVLQANNAWLTFKSSYSPTSEYDFFPTYGYFFFFGSCADISCRSHVLWAYNMQTKEIFGTVTLNSMPPQVYMLNVDTEIKAAIILASQAYIDSIYALGSFNQWQAQHPATPQK